MIYHKACASWDGCCGSDMACLSYVHFVGMKKIYSSYLESPGTKAYTIEEARHLSKNFSDFEVNIELSTGDLLEADAGSRHEGPLLSLARLIYPRFLIRLLSRFVPIGLFMLITVKK